MHDFNEAAYGPIIEAAGKGLPQRLIADLCGIQRSVLIDWLRKGDDGEEPFCRFSTAYRRAAAEWGKTEWEAAGGEAKTATGPQWRLEKRYPEDFGNRATVDVNHSGGTELRITGLEDMPTERLLALLAEKRRMPVLEAEVRVIGMGGGVGDGVADDPERR